MFVLEDLQKLIVRSSEIAFIPDFLKEHPQAELYLVGGAVRDLLLKRVVEHVDFDFVIRGLSHEEIQAWFDERGSMDFTGAHFGVFKFMPNGFDPQKTKFIDIALPRTERSHEQSAGGYREFYIQSDPTLPIEDDLSRRDFTVNAMAINLRTNELVDPFDGQSDLQEASIRCVGNPEERFKEDLTRILRGIRFASELGFTIELATLEAMKKRVDHIHTKQNGEYLISRETIGLELAKAFSRNPMATGVWLDLSDALAVLFPGVDRQAIERLKDVKPNQPQLAVTLLLLDQSQDEARQILLETGLNSLPKHSPLRLELDAILLGIERMKEAESETWIQGMRAHRFEKIFMNGHGTFMFDLLAHTRKTDIAERAHKRKKLIEERWNINPFELIPALVSGDDILSAKIEPGPRVRQLLEHIRDEQLEGRVMTREQAIQILRVQTEKK